jgi:glyoxylase-like metal-dependent hydrolase (beta-lactamase superfamily II)
MSVYLQSLEKLKKRRVSRIAPGHGDVIDEPRAKIEDYIKHRKARERQILKALKDGPVRITDIVGRLYTDTPPELHDWAGRQVHAHLLKLKAEGKAEGGSVKSAWKLA